MTLKQVFKKIIGEVDESNLVLNWNHIREASNGHYVCPDDPNASRFCIIGHVGRYRDKLSLNVFTLKKRPTCEFIYKNVIFYFRYFYNAPMKWANKDLKPDKH